MTALPSGAMTPARRLTLLLAFFTLVALAGAAPPPAFAIGPVICLEGEPCPVCGDSICDPAEEGGHCPFDCDPFYGWCGDNLCNGFEDCSTCSADCGSCAPPVCGNSACEAGESCSSCAADCGACGPVCGNGVCQSGESCSSCAADCGACPSPLCGDAVCDAAGGETCSTCSGDCGACGGGDDGGGTCNPPQACQPTCGNSVCETGESCSSCAVDCGSCPGNPVCGDGVCDLSMESCTFCWDDCCPGGGGTGTPCHTDDMCWGGSGGFGCDIITHTCCDTSKWWCWPMND